MSGRTNTYWNSYLPVFFDRMSSLMRSHMTEIVDNYGLTSAHAIYLIALRINGPMTQRELSHFLDMDPANTNRVVKTLKEKGMIYDDRSTEDGKNYKIFLNRIGSQLADEVMKSTDEWMDSIMADVPFEDVMHLRNILIGILVKMDPKLEDYMNSENTSYYYTYLSLNAADDGWKYHVSNRTEDDE